MAGLPILKKWWSNFDDILDVLKQLKDENPQPFIDLIHIDPPFNANAITMFLLK